MRPHGGEYPRCCFESAAIRMRIAHLGTFDVDNYGDLLFPLVAQWRLPGASWVHISPCGGRAEFVDSVNTIRFDEATTESFDAVVVGGGNIVHLRRSSLAQYSSLAGMAYPALSLGATALARCLNVPLVFNGPSVRKVEMGRIETRLLADIFSQSSYTALRDEFSVSLADRSGATPARMIPDTAFDISRMWPIESRNEVGRVVGHVVVHVNRRYGGDAYSTAKAIDRICSKSGGNVQFLPIGPCHGDIEYMREVSAHMSCPSLSSSVLSLRAFAEQIATAQAYVGSSMHGFITAISYGVPALLVLENRPLEKFGGLLKTLEAPAYVICNSWEDAVTRFDRRWTIDSNVRNQIFSSLDEHWTDLEAAVGGQGVKKSPATIAHWSTFVKLSQMEVGIRRAVRWITKMRSYR